MTDEKKTVTVRIVQEVEVAVRPHGPQDPGEYWWEVYDVKTDAALDSVYTEEAGDEDAALEQALATAEDNLHEDAKGTWTL